LFVAGFTMAFFLRGKLKYLFRKLFKIDFTLFILYSNLTVTAVSIKIMGKHSYIYIYTGCPRRNVPDFGRVFLMLNYTDITQNT